MNLESLSSTIGMLGGLLGSGGGAAQCLGSLPQLAAGLASANSASKSCRLLRNGGEVSFEGQENSVAIVGCIDLCGVIADRIREAGNRVNQFAQENPTGAQQLVSNATTLLSDIGKAKNKCGERLAEGEGKANQQSAGMEKSLQGAAQCAQALMAGEDIPEDAAAIAAIDCGNSSDAAANPSVCQGYGGVNGGSDGILGKTSGFDLATTSGAEDLPDDDVASGPENGTPIDTPLGSAAAAAKTTSAGGLGSGSGSGGAQQKAGRRRGAGKSKKLVAGYKTSRGGSSGSSGSRSPSAFKGFKNKFKFKKKKDKKDKAALAALSKLVKAGISPDQSGSIFERVSNRFAATTTKENLFDCKRNKKLWMEK